MKVIWSGVSALAVAASVALALALRYWGLGLPVQILVLALGVASASLAGRWAALACSAATVLAFNYWFTEPLFTLSVDDPQNYAVFALLLVLGAVVGTLADRLRRLAREHLLQAFSHDLRTPLAVIAGTAALLRTGPARTEALSVIEREIRDLDRQVDNLIALARVGSGLNFVLVPAEELLFSCRDRCESWLPGMEVDVPDEVPLVSVDTGLLEQALLNLVVNATRHASGVPRLSLAARGRQVELRVGDRGVGVPDDEKNAVFRRFVRGRSSRGTGHGLGLSLVAEVARLHRGGAGVRDRDGGGAEFFITLPLKGRS